MNSKMNLLSSGALLALLLGALSIPLLAQHNHQGKPDAGKKEGEINVGKKGEATFATPIRVGDTSLKAGDYVFQHKIDGVDHVVIFRRAGKEVARVKCTVEPLDQKPTQTALYTRVGDGGEIILDAVVVRGEKIKHIT